MHKTDILMNIKHRLFASACFLVTFCGLGFTALAAEVDVSFPKVGPQPLSTIPENAMVLHDGWEMKESAIVGMDGHLISSSNYRTEGWYSATMPDTALGVLVRHGVYPDPYIGMNGMKIPDASDAYNQRYDLAKYTHMPDGSNPWAKPYWFRKKIEVPKTYAGQTVWLNFDGINYRADVWLNGKQVAGSKEIVGMFKRFRLNVTDYVMPGKTNVLAVAVHPVDNPGDPVEAQLGSLGGGFGPNSGDGEILRDVTRYQNIGWDWIPACPDRSLGMWQHVSMNTSGPVVVSDPAAFTDVKIAEETVADVKIRLFAENVSKDYKMVDLVVEIENPEKSAVVATLRHKIALSPESRREIIINPEDHEALRLKNPKLWWPVNYGDQPLYHLKVTAEDQRARQQPGKQPVRRARSGQLHPAKRRPRLFGQRPAGSNRRRRMGHRSALHLGRPTLPGRGQADGRRQRDAGAGKRLQRDAAGRLPRCLR